MKYKILFDTENHIRSNLFIETRDFTFVVIIYRLFRIQVHELNIETEESLTEFYVN